MKSKCKKYKDRKASDEPLYDSDVIMLEELMKYLMCTSHFLYRVFSFSPDHEE